MKARIIGQNHTITPYEVNGRKRYVVEEIPKTVNRKIVNEAVYEMHSRQWHKVYNWIDDWISSPISGGIRLEDDKQLLSTIESMTY